MSVMWSQPEIFALPLIEQTSLPCLQKSPQSVSAYVPFTVCFQLVIPYREPLHHWALITLQGFSPWSTRVGYPRQTLQSPHSCLSNIEPTMIVAAWPSEVKVMAAGKGTLTVQNKKGALRGSTVLMWPSLSRIHSPQKMWSNFDSGAFSSKAAPVLFSRVVLM